MGWIPCERTLGFYNATNVFCFRSIREFGGAVVLKAMASALTCIVGNNGGISEYVTDARGLRIKPKSRSYIVNKVAETIRKLVMNNELREAMSRSARIHAQSFKWDAKRWVVRNIYIMN
jgi:starch synthase